MSDKLTETTRDKALALRKNKRKEMYREMSPDKIKDLINQRALTGLGATSGQAQAATGQFRNIQESIGNVLGNFAGDVKQATPSAVQAAFEIGGGLLGGKFSQDKLKGAAIGSSISSVPGTWIKQYLERKWDVEPTPSLLKSLVPSLSTDNETADNVIANLALEGGSNLMQMGIPKIFGAVARRFGATQFDAGIKESYDALVSQIGESNLPIPTTGSEDVMMAKALNLFAPGSVDELLRVNRIRVAQALENFADEDGVKLFLERSNTRKPVFQNISNAFNRLKVRKDAEIGLVPDSMPASSRRAIKFTIAIDDNGRILKAAEDKIWGELRTILGPNARVVVSGKTLTSLDELRGILEDQIKGGKTYLQKPLDTLINSADPSNLKGIPWEDFKELRTAVGKEISNAIFSSKGNRNLIQLKSTLNDAFDNFLGSQKDGARVKEIAARASGLTDARYFRLPFRLQQAFKGDVDKLWDYVFSSPLNATKFMALVGKSRRAKQAVREEALSRLFNMHQDPKGLIDIDAVMRTWVDPKKQGLSQVFSDVQRDNIQRLLDVSVEFNTRNLGMAGFLAYRAGSLGIGLGSSTARAALGGGGIGEAVLQAFTSAVGSASVLIGFNKVTKAILLNPDFTKVATGLMKARPDSPEAIAAARKLFEILKGVEVIIETKNKKTGEIQQTPFRIPIKRSIQFSKLPPRVSGQRRKRK